MILFASLKICLSVIVLKKGPLVAGLCALKKVTQQHHKAFKSKVQVPHKPIISHKYEKSSIASHCVNFPPVYVAKVQQLEL